MLVDEVTRIVVQGVADRGARLIVAQMASYGTTVVGAVGLDGSGGEVAGVSVYGSLEDVIGEQRPNAALIVSPPRAVLAAALEALDQGIRLLVIATEGVPQRDAMFIFDRAQAAAARVVGPDAIGLINPAARVKVGAIGGGDPAQAFPPGRIGVITRGGMAAGIGRAIKQVGLGVSTAIGIGGDRLVGTDPATLLPLFQRDQATDGVVLVGEPETPFVEEVAEVLGSRRYLKPLIAVIGGRVIRALPEGDAIAQATTILNRRAARLNIRQDVLREVGAIVTGDLGELPLYLSLIFKNQVYLENDSSSAGS